MIPDRIESHLSSERSRRRVITFANRLPVSSAGGTWRVSDGGLVAALRPALAARSATWVGWDPSPQGVPDRIPGLDFDLRAVNLTRREVDDYYHGFANRALWPLLHGVVEQPVFERRMWDAYRRVNARFAAEDPGGPGVRWVHDYQLLLLPGALRALGVAEPVGLFLHVPFPPPEVFMRIPWRTQLLEGMLGANLISFHTASYRDNFRRTCLAAHDGLSVERGGLRTADGRFVELRANPISIDASGLAQAARAADVERHVARLRRRFEGRTVLLGVDRLDYTKGIPHRLRAVQRLFELNPKRREHVTFVQLAVPSRGEIREYDDLRSSVEQLVGRINGRFTEGTHQLPVHYLHRRVPHAQLLAYYRLADVCLVTPLVDGMNLVAKEYVTVQHATDGAGVLVLSEFAGAAEELREALPCNPFDVDGLAATIDLALELTPEDRRWRMTRMAEVVARHDVFAWAADELARLDASVDASTPQAA